MASWSFTKIQDFPLNLGEVISGLNGSTTIKFGLTNTAPASETSNPTVDGNGVLANITQISYTNYTDSLTTDRVLQSVTWTDSAGTATLDAADFSITASGGSIATFQYFYLYDDAPTSPADPLIGLWTRASALTLADTEQVNITINASGFLTVA